MLESGDPVLRELIVNLLKANPLQRWSAQQVLAFLQFDFALDIQRIWRGFKLRQRLRLLTTSIMAFQAHVKGALARRNFAPTSSFADRARSAIEDVAVGGAANDARDFLEQFETDTYIRGDDVRGPVPAQARQGLAAAGAAGAAARGGGAVASGAPQDEIDRLSALLQARDVQLGILMEMLAEADANSVRQQQEIAGLKTRIASFLAS